MALSWCIYMVNGDVVYCGFEQLHLLITFMLRYSTLSSRLTVLMSHVILDE